MIAPNHRASQKRYLFNTLVAFLLAACTIGCEKVIVDNYPELGENPFAGIDYEDGVLDDMPLDSSSFLGIHSYILAPSCAVPGCHDGHFEPDFRTIQSTYETLVFHPVVKNNAESSFDYRVEPGSKERSWLYERITTDDPVLGRMPLYDTLSTAEIRAIGDWIDQGAGGLDGTLPQEPNLSPSVFGILAYLDDSNGIRFDTLRADAFSPIELPRNSVIELWLGLYDSDPQGTFIDGNQLSQTSLLISEHPFDYGQAIELTLEDQAASEPHYGSTFFSNSYQLPYYHSVRINTSQFAVNHTYFMRAVMQDPDHAEPVTWPDDGSLSYYLTLMSFIVRP
jgi:hypothetical protein